MDATADRTRILMRVWGPKKTVSMALAMTGGGPSAIGLFGRAQKK
jgi:hypothetical protein